VEVSLRREEDGLAIDVADSGIGIAPDFLPYVFDRFRQADASSARRHGGLGLGLAIARQLVELQGGTITVASPGEGKGATFTVHLPLAPAEAARSAVPEARSLYGAGRPSADLSGLAILVVEDELDSLELVQQVLSETQATVLTAMSAHEALRIVERHHPDLLISDIGMPRMDGFELIGAVRAMQDRRASRVPAIALTAFSRKEDQQRALEAGFDEFLAKPLRPAVLLQTVQAIVEKKALLRAV
jgi:CheY-like chemotaxis protein